MKATVTKSRVVANSTRKPARERKHLDGVANQLARRAPKGVKMLDFVPAMDVQAVMDKLTPTITKGHAE